MLTKNQFIFKFIWWFNLYANILFFVAIVCFLTAINIWKILALFFVISGIISLFFAIRITLRFNKKYQYYKVQVERIEKYGYSIDFFESSVMDPCFRLLTKQILYDFGKTNDYKTIIKNFGNTQRVLIYKSNKLLEKIKAEDNKC